jgi:hypothetical protein
MAGGECQYGRGSAWQGRSVLGNRSKLDALPGGATLEDAKVRAKNRVNVALDFMAERLS